MNRHNAEHYGYFENTTFIEDVKTQAGEIKFYDSNTGKLLFTAPKGRSMENFLEESRDHGWPSFRGTLGSNDTFLFCCFERTGTAILCYENLNTLLTLDSSCCYLRRPRSELGLRSCFTQWRVGQCRWHASGTQLARWQGFALLHQPCECCWKSYLTSRVAGKSPEKHSNFFITKQNLLRI
jgi:hypothetical protein